MKIANEAVAIGKQLRWDDSTLIVRSVKARHDNAMLNLIQLNSLLEKHLSRRASDIQKAIKSREFSALFELFDSPEINFRVHLALAKSDWCSLFEFVEAHLLGKGDAGQRDRASGRNDVVLVDTQIDFWSDAARRPIEGTSIPELATLELEEEPSSVYCDLCVDKVRSAVAGIESISPIAAQFVGAELRTIIVRSNPFHIDRYSSFSSLNYVGRTYLINLDRRHVTSADVASSLIHEAIHAHLYRVERLSGLVHTDSHGVGVESPWTGKELGLSTFVHAVYVWFALCNFWQLPHSEDHFEAVDVLFQRSLAARGFNGPDLRAAIEGHLPYIREEVGEELLQMALLFH